MSNKKIKRKDYIKGGLADNKKVSDFNPSSLKEGTKLEMEHTSNKAIAREIAMDHLTEDKKYYKKLKRIEKQDMLDISVDGKQEIVQGKEPLKKDPNSTIKNRWKALKKGLNNLESIMDLKEASRPDQEDKEKAKQQTPMLQQQGEDQQGEDQQGEDQQGEDQQGEDQQGEDQQEQSKDPTHILHKDGKQIPIYDEEQEKPEQEQPEQEQDEEQQEPEQFDQKAHEQEIIASLKEEGYSDSEIAHIVYGHHTASYDSSNEAKAEATRAMSEVNAEHTKKLGDIDREMKIRQMELDHEHSRRMKDLEYEHAHMQSPDPETEKNHKKRMLDLEYENAKASSPDNYDKQHSKQLMDLDLEQRKLELEKRKQEIALELEFKKRELELKIKRAKDVSNKKIEVKLADSKSKKTEEEDGN